MVHPDHLNVESGLVKSLSSTGSAFAITFLFLVFQYTFKLDFQCPCERVLNAVFCLLYIIFPVIIIFCILTITSKMFTVVCLGHLKYNCCKCCGPEPCSPTCCYIFKRLIRNLVLSCLWIVTVLIDGDVIVCWNLTEVNITSWQDQIPCKEKGNLTPEEFNSLKRHQTLSEISGLVLLLIIPLFWFLLSIIGQCCKNPYKNLYEEIYEDKAINLAEMRLQDKAKTTAEDNYDNIEGLSDLNNLEAYSEGMITLLGQTTTTALSFINTALSSITSNLSSITSKLSAIALECSTFSNISLTTSEPSSKIQKFTYINSKLISIISELSLIKLVVCNPTLEDSSINSTISETTSGLASNTCKLCSVISKLASTFLRPSLITSEFPSITTELSSVKSDLASISEKLVLITPQPSSEIDLTITALSLINSNLSLFTTDLSKFSENLNNSAQPSTSASSTT